MLKKGLLFTCFILLMVCSSALAGKSDPLFINLTSEDGHRSLMALGFGKAQMERGHSLTVWMNDKAVMMASAKNKAQFREQQELIAEIIAKGAQVLVCPFCSKTFGVNEADLIQGTRMGNPETTGEALFQDNTKTLSW
ncbi:MAG: DsrE family protein [Solidesulfovibrio sp. DCME]|uniref:DsrE family protein n=1 Tax=Solidesulfovibrio sp. DCME TaxID=3447380 RepID=UPI003D11C133